MRYLLARRWILLNRTLSIAYFAFMLLLMSWLFAQAIDRSPPVETVDQDVLTPVVKAGEDLKIRYSIDRHRSCDTTLSYVIFDGAGEIHGFGPIPLGVMGGVAKETYTRAYRVPISSAPGPARLRIVASWMCPGNYLQSIYPITHVQDDIHFTVTGP